MNNNVSEINSFNQALDKFEFLTNQHINLRQNLAFFEEDYINARSCLMGAGRRLDNCPNICLYTDRLQNLIDRLKPVEERLLKKYRFPVGEHYYYTTGRLLTLQRILREKQKK